MRPGLSDHQDRAARILGDNVADQVESLAAVFLIFNKRKQCEDTGPHDGVLRFGRFRGGPPKVR